MLKRIFTLIVAVPMLLSVCALAGFEETTALDVTDPFRNQDVVKRFTIGKYSYLVNGTAAQVSAEVIEAQ